MTSTAPRFLRSMRDLGDPGEMEMEMEETRLDVGLGWIRWTLEAELPMVKRLKRVKGGHLIRSDPLPRLEFLQHREHYISATSSLACLSSSHAMKSKNTPSSSHHARDSHAHDIQSTPVSPPSSCAGRDDWHSRRIHMRIKIREYH